ncbi:MAG TPA: hypothetical protein VMT43_08050 [Acidimicrobiales bacterium]|nr:hypothetical protein [Acidimicrobiales bacterium]
MHTLTRRGGLAALMVLVLATFGLATAPSAGAADFIVPIKWNVNASTHLKNLNLDVTVPQGTFTGTVDVTTGALQGTLSLPPATQTISFLGIPLATATFAMTPTGPITGHVDLKNKTASVDSSFNFNITSATLSLLPHLNLVGDHCHGSTPISVSMSGPVNLTGASTFSSTYTIPPLTGCGFVTPILNLVVPSSGNTFTATFAPPT